MQSLIILQSLELGHL